MTVITVSTAEKLLASMHLWIALKKRESPEVSLSPTTTLCEKKGKIERMPMGENLLC